MPLFLWTWDTFHQIIGVCFFYCFSPWPPPPSPPPPSPSPPFLFLLPLQGNLGLFFSLRRAVCSLWFQRPCSWSSQISLQYNLTHVCLHRLPEGRSRNARPWYIQDVSCSQSVWKHWSPGSGLAQCASQRTERGLGEKYLKCHKIKTLSHKCNHKVTGGRSWWIQRRLFSFTDSDDIGIHFPNGKKRMDPIRERILVL